jgi:hypothetical protein
VLRTILWNRNEHNVQRNEARMQFLQAQISELYSPLLSHLSETNAYYEMLQSIVERLRREDIARALPQRETERRIRAVEQRFDRDYFNPLKESIAELLRSRRHLIAEDQFPQAFSDFLRHAMEWDATRAVVEELGEDYDYSGISGAKWPAGIVEQVELTLHGLRRQYRRHLRSLGRLR